MKIKCLYSTGEILMDYERKPLGTSKQTQYGLSIGVEYLVMGMIMANGYLTYLINDGRAISTYPCQLFEITDNTIPSNWYFKSVAKHSVNYTNQEAVWGYYELVFDNTHYEKLIDFDEGAHLIFFKRKMELENEMAYK